MFALRGSAKSTDGTEDVTRYTRDVLGGLGYREEGPFGRRHPPEVGVPRRPGAYGGYDGAAPPRAASGAPRESSPGRARAATLTMHEVVATLNHRSEFNDAPQVNGVTLASCMRAKGLEWDAAFRAA